jgi:hypothetical protein
MDEAGNFNLNAMRIEERNIQQNRYINTDQSLTHERRTPYNKDIFAPFSPSRASNLDKPSDSSQAKHF